MKIYTSYFAKARSLPSNVVPIAICGKSPDWWNGNMEYKRLAPKKWFFYEWKKTGDDQFYIDHYQEEVLDLLDQDTVVKELFALSGGKDVALLCYEKPSSFCHRHLVADWLNKAGYRCEEFAALIDK